MSRPWITPQNATSPMSQEDSNPAWVRGFVITGIIFSIFTLGTNIWSIITIFSWKKLRKPLWLFRASLCGKDVIVSMLLICPLAFDISHVDARLNEQKGVYYETVISIILISSISSSIYVALCISVDRYHSITRPFRYHTGLLMSTKVSIVLIVYCWIIGIATGISVSTGSDGLAMPGGMLIKIAPTTRIEKWLLFSGLGAVYIVSSAILIKSLLKIRHRKREQTGSTKFPGGAPERIRSRRNSMSEEASDKLVRQRVDSESVANDFFYRAEMADQITSTFTQANKKKKWSLLDNHKISFFTPTTYRPSILRRIRDTWYLYTAIYTSVITFFMTLLPIFFIVVAGSCRNANVNFSVPGQVFTDDEAAKSSSLRLGQCLAICISECFMIAQGTVCVILYNFTDDVFRPKFLRPLRSIILKFSCCKSERERRESYYKERYKKSSQSFAASETTEAS